ncbi:radical SAM protein [Bacillus sp. ISL-51]|uniref:SPL family radical SAM protein n=1 Tax=Bacteria TaxID=2 RepID=UPI001BE5A128|nr:MULTISPECIES: radical SAM protein [unclassified Bacillus (in: firmicutes)]MBT2575047.1 radical SAM protein [Bacillus sp. ISL-51]MBT2634288.1 radical SAM protein [Bacillus sp. ISL-26]MBT2713857.1 radical SAM protein [Pseudomonas sp. ISL-88]
MKHLLYKQPKTMLNKGSGFLSGYSHTLNPYTGCTFGCSYCYVRRMPVSSFRKEEWGTWVDIKQGAAELLEKELTRAKRKGSVTIFMSSSTDPYQPIEQRERVTRTLLEVMSVNQPDFLLVQTRSPLVQRDIDLLGMLKDRVRVSITIETDREDIRRRFAPNAPSIQGRLHTLKILSEAGIPVQAAVAPTLPSTEAFPEKLAPHVSRVCIDDYFMGDGSGGKRTRRLGIESIYEELDMREWYSPGAYRKVYNRMADVFSQDQLYVSRDGFLP